MEFPPISPQDSDTDATIITDAEEYYRQRVFGMRQPTTLSAFMARESQKVSSAFSQPWQATKTSSSNMQQQQQQQQVEGPPPLPETHEEESWNIDRTGHLVVPETICQHILALGLAPRDAAEEEALIPPQRKVLAELIAQDMQYEAFAMALHFTVEDAFAASASHERGFTAEPYLYTYASGIVYPGIDIIMNVWRDDSRVSCYLAYYLLRGMLKRYNGFSFPDRVDVHETGYERSRLLVPYSADCVNGKEPERVRRRIVQALSAQMFSTPLSFE